MCGQLDSFSRLFEWESVGYERIYVQFAGKNDSSDFGLQGQVRRVASDQVFFIDTYRRQIQLGSGAAPRMGKQQDFPGAIHERLGLANRLIRRSTNDHSVQTLFTRDSANVPD